MGLKTQANVVLLLQETVVLLLLDREALSHHEVQMKFLVVEEMTAHQPTVAEEQQMPQMSILEGVEWVHHHQDHLLLALHHPLVMAVTTIRSQVLAAAVETTDLITAVAAVAALAAAHQIRLVVDVTQMDGVNNGIY